MNGGSELDIEKGDDVPIVVPLLVDDGPAFRRRTVVENIDPLEGPDTAPPRPVDYTFRGRHVEMIAIGISMGTGVLADSGTYLWWGGPFSLLLGYLLMWTVLFAVMMSLREMITPFPIPGAVFSMANRVLCPAIGFAAGWTYCIGYAMDFPNKVNAAAGFVEFWDTEQRYKHLWLTIFFLVPIGFNFLYVRRLGEIEYWFTTIKIILILILIVTGVIIAMGLPTQPLLGTSAQYKPVPCADNEVGNCMPGFGVINWRQVPFKTPFATGALGGIAGFWKCCTLAVFSYTGCECVGITADEVERQRETLPRAVNKVTSRILYLYVGALLVLGLNLSANDPILSEGIVNSNNFPGGFIVMVQRANISIALPHIINAIMILAVIAVANADLYIASRCVYALAREHHAPSILARHTWGGVPYLALIPPASFGFFAYLALLEVSGFEIFQLFSSITSVAILLAWGVICATYLRFRRGIKAQRLERTLEERANSPLQPYLAGYGLVMCFLSAIFAGFEAFTRGNIVWSQWAVHWEYTFAPFAVIAVFIGLVVVSRFVIGSSAFEVPLENKMDLKTQRARKLAPLPSSKFTLRTAIDKALNF